MESERWYGITRWAIEDVQAQAAEQGIQMSDEEAAAWWAEHESAFKNLMVAHGNEVLSDMLSC